jgi:hypothetical protein
MKKIVAVFGFIYAVIGSVYSHGSAPVIASFSPQSGTNGTVVTIGGTNFDPNPGNNTVRFGAVQAVVSAASATNLTVSVPVGATYAPITETVNGLTAYANAYFLPTFLSSGVLTNSSLGPQITLPTGNGPGQVVIADFDGDGKPDLAVNNGGDHNIYIYRNISTNGTLTAVSFAPPVILPLGTGGENKMVAADIDGDGRPDLVLVDYNGSQVMVLQNLCTPGIITTNSFGPRVSFAVGSYPRGVAVRDLDGDGKPDIVVANWGSNSISVLRNIGTVGSITTNSFAPAVQFASGADCEDVVIADLDGDGKPDVVTANETNSNNSAVSVFRNISTLGNIAFAPRMDFQGPIYSYQLAIGDMDGDGKLDVVFVSFANGQSVSVYRNTSTPGNITFAPRIDFGLGGWGNGVALGDLDGSGKPDMVAPTQSSSQLSLFKNVSSPGSFTNSSLAARLDFGSGSNPMGVAIGDLDGDGRPDIVFANNYGNTLSIYQNIVPFGGPPAIATQPMNQTVTMGGTATFSIVAGGSTPLSYQWNFNGTNIAGATNSTLTLTNVQPSQAGNYAVQVTNSYGSTSSLTATLTVNIPVCDTPPSGLVGWWKGDGNGYDSVGGNDATVPPGVTYAPGEVGLGFNLNGNTNRILAPDAPQLNFGSNQDFSIEAWIQPLSNPGNYTDLSGEVMTVISKRYAPNTSTALGYEMYLGGGRLCFQMIDSLNNGGNYYNLGVEPDLRDGKFHHVAVTVQRNSTTGLQFYVDGQVISTFDPTSVHGDLSNTWPFRIGNHPTTNLPAFYHGIIDEVSLYNRALSSNEVAAIYSAGSAGKCFTPVAPLIVMQPTNQSVLVGGTVNFNVTASGTGPLSYQWSFNGTNIAGATNHALTLNNVQLTQVGNYSVLVANAVASTNSVAAALTVNIPVCDTPPSGLVSWWRAEGDANDSIGTNNGTLNGGTTFTAGEVGQAFSFNGSNSYVLVPSSPSIKTTGPFTIEAWASYSGFSAGQTGDSIVSKGQDAEAAIDWAMNISTPKKLRVHINAGGNWYQYDGAAILKTNTWYHLAMVYDGTNLLSYVNGAADGNTAVPGILQATDNPLKIGAYAPINGVQSKDWFNGLIDEVSFYNRALSSSEIAAIYNASSAGKCFTPVAPVVTTQPVNQVVLMGGTANFSVTASGTGPLSYQWSLNGTNVNNATNATLTLNNVQLTQVGNYSVLVANAAGSTNSVVAALTVVLPPILTQQPQGESVVSFNNASFTVAAAGTGPLNYQWRKGGTNLVDGGNVSGSTTTNLNLASVSLNDAGNYDVVVSNPYATTNSAVAVLTVPQTGMMLGSASATSGNTVVVPVLMNALGVENTFLASVAYDPTKLVLQNVQLGQATAGAYLQEVDTKTNSGLVGFAILMGSGPTVPVGTNEQVALLNFQALPVTSNTTVNVFFTNSPTLQQTYDNNFNLLPMTYSNAAVTLLPAEYEADVYPRTNGDHQVNVQDWLEEGRMVAGLDVLTNSDELLRADCAPRNAPDGVLTVADWVQAGRYALGLDPLTPVTPVTPVTPPSSPSLAVQKGLKFTPLGSPAPMRTLQIGYVAAQRGQPVNVPVQLVCTTNENAFGLTVSFNTNQLKLTGVSMGSAMTIFGRTNINYKPGKLGMIVAMAPGASLAPGTNQLLVLQFMTSTNAIGQSVLSLDNSVVQLQVADKTANVMAANYVNGAVILPPPPSVTTTKTGANLQLTWPISTGTFQVQLANSPTGPWTNTTLTITTNGASATVTVSATNQQQYFRLTGQ